MYNPRFSHLKAKNKKNNVSDSSKKIKKDKNAHQLKVVKRLKGLSQQRVEELKPQNQSVSLEEGEEDPNADIAMLQQEVLDFDIDEKPLETLIDEYHKFPQYIEVKVSPQQFFSYKSLFTSANLHSIEMLSKQTKN